MTENTITGKLGNVTEHGTTLMLQLGLAMVTGVAICLAGSGTLLAVAESQPPEVATVDLVGAIGGSVTAVEAADGVVFAAEGARMRAYAADTEVRPLGSTAPLPGRITDLAVAGRFAYLAMPGIGLGVVDVSDPARPRHVARFESPGRDMLVAASNDLAYGCGFRREPDGERRLLGRLSAWDMHDVSAPVERFTVDLCGPMVADDEHLYVLEYGFGVRVFAATGPRAGTLVGELRLGTADASEMHGDLALDGTTLIVAAHGLHAVDVSAPVDPTLLGTLPGVVDGRSIARDGDTAFVLGLAMFRELPDGTTDRVMDPGIALVDLSDLHDMLMSALQPIGSCCQLGVTEGLGFVGGPQLVTVAARDDGSGIASITTLVEPWTPGVGLASHGESLLVSTTDGRGLSIDVSYPEDPVPQGDFVLDGSVRRFHVAGDRLYAATDRVTGTGLLWIGLLDEHDLPVWVGSYEPEEAMPPWTDTAVTDVVVRDRLAYLSVAAVNRSGWFESRLEVVDVEHALAPTLVGVLTLASDGQCQITDTRIAMQDDRAYLSGADCLWIVDVSQPDTPQVIGRHELGDSPLSWSALDLAVFDSYVVVPSAHGVTVLDAADPSAVRTAAERELPDFGYSAPVLASGLLRGAPCVVAADPRSLWVLDMREPTRPTAIGQYHAQSDLFGVSWTFQRPLVLEGHVYLTTSTGGMQALRLGGSGDVLPFEAVLPYSAR